MNSDLQITAEFEINFEKNPSPVETIRKSSPKEDVPLSLEGIFLGEGGWQQHWILPGEPQRWKGKSQGGFSSTHEKIKALKWGISCSFM